MIMGNKCRTAMYKENKRRRHDRPRTPPVNINGDNDEMSESKPARLSESVSDFLVCYDIMDNGNDFDYCLMCMKTGNSMRYVSTSEQMTLLCDYRVYSSPNARWCVIACCEAPQERSHEPAYLSSHQVQRLICELMLELSRAKPTPLLAEDDPALSDDDYRAWTGWDISQVKSMTSLRTSRMNKSQHRAPFEAVCLFWMQLKTNLSFRQIGILFRIDTEEENTRLRVEDAFHAVLGYLNEALVSRHIGLTHLP